MSALELIAVLFTCLGIPAWTWLATRERGAALAAREQAAERWATALTQRERAVRAREWQLQQVGRERRR